MIRKFLIFFIATLIVLNLASYVYAASRSVKVISYAGDVKIIPPKKREPVQCRLGMSLSSGTKVITANDSYLAVAFDSKKKNIVKIKENSYVIIKLSREDKIELVDGQIMLLLESIKKGESFRVRTPSAVCGARGTGWRTTIDGEATTIAVFDGEVFARGIDKNGLLMDDEYWTKWGYKRTIKKYESPQDEVKLPEEEVEKMLEEMKMLLNANNISQIMVEEDKQALLNKSKMTALDNRLERIERRMDSMAGMAIGGGGAVGPPGRGDKDDDRK